MKYLRILAILIVPGLLMVGCSKEDPTTSSDQHTILKGGNKGDLDLNGAHFELNLVAKFDNWNENEFDNPSRHTIFIPRNTADWNIELRTPNNLGETSLPGIRIDMSQGPEFAVLDGTVFDGDKAEFQLGPGKYAVYVAMRGKKNVDPAYIASWLEALQTTTLDGTVTDELWYYQKLGEVTVTRKWTNITSLFTITATEAGDLPFDPALGTAQWIFDYMQWLGLQEITLPDGSVVTYSDLAYFWQLVNHGSQLIKVRFYPI
jgi:hypothetical protein